METLKTNSLKDKIFLTGLSLIILSTGIFLLPDIESFQIKRDSYFGIFFLNYFFSLAFLTVLIINSFRKYRWGFRKNKIEYTLLSLVLFIISAFSLNREIPVFEQSTEWICVYLVVQCTTIILLNIREKLPTKLITLLYFFLGAGSVLYIYYAIYLLPFSAIGVLGLLFFGIAIHVFIPILLTIYTLIFFFKTAKNNTAYQYSFITGLAAPIIVAVVFIFQWNSVKNKIDYITNESVMEETSLPLWAKLSQRLPKSMLTERIMKTGLVYTTPTEDNFWGWNFPTKSFDEVRKHDPLVMMACMFSGKANLDETEKIKILESMYDSRHQAQERLWSGDMLETVNVISNVKIFPEHRIAYTEKILSIRNNQPANTWRNTQEAIYTFHLPEGGVVTSLSLWINGKEEKGIMTTKGKADSAYKTIVGVEQRDPSLVHWQEGNTISARVFPCTPYENRRFKIGVTAPLHKKDKQLAYENIYFDGPPCKNASESIQVQFTQKADGVTFPFSFSESGNNTFKLNKRYEPYWEIGLESPELSQKGFSFDSCYYTITDYKKMYEHFEPQFIYLDVNNSWTKNEFEALCENLKKHTVYVCKEDVIEVTTENMNSLFDELSSYNFSVLPLHSIKEVDKSLIISKSKDASPNLNDIKESAFSNNLTNFLKEKKQIRLFNLGEGLSPYLKTLKELRVFLYDSGSKEELFNLISEKKYVKNQESESSIVIDNAQIMINESGVVADSGAPDHLLRLFAYNHIMKNVSERYFKSDYINDEAISEAKKAYVVSPVSSLIVLETQHDYDRFGISDDANSLKNASMQSSGAVPEPHEWLLIGLTALIVFYLLYKNYLERKAII